MTSTCKQLLVGTRKGLFTVDRSDEGWSVGGADFLGDHVSAMLHDARDGARYAALKHGHFGPKLHVSRDDGASWEEIATPAYPARPEDSEPDRCPVRGIEIPWTTDMMWELTPGGADQPGRLWCGTIPGGLFRSDDCGASWELVRSLWDRPERKKWMGGGYDLPGIHSVCVHPDDSRRVAVAISCGGVWLSEDDGESWHRGGVGLRAAYTPPEHADDPDIQDAHRMVRCASQPDHFWIQHHNGIFASSDGAETWREIPEAGPSTFGFAVAVHPRDPARAWFIPAIKDERRIPVDGKLVVTRTSDGGESFEVLATGLPQEHAYDIAYRHALAISGDGNTLAFGSTTGSLWISDSQGDSWTRATAHLPPIHCVQAMEDGP